MKIFFVIPALFFIFTLSFSSDASNIVEEVVIKSSSQGRKTAVSEAIEEATLKQIQFLIGEEKFNKNLREIKTKILPSASRFVLYQRVNSVTEPQAGLQVTLRISRKNLESLLLERGLLYRFEGFPQIFPLVKFTDRVNGESYSWWKKGGLKAPFMKNLASEMIEKIRSKAQDKGFHTIDPVNGPLELMVPKHLQSESLSTADQLSLASLFKAQILLKGQAVISKQEARQDSFQIELRLIALHSNNGRTIGEVIRKYETSSGSFKQVVTSRASEAFDKVAGDLSGQIYEAWKSGTFGANLVRLVLQGEINYQNSQSIKKEILNGIRSVKAIRERKIEPGRLTFDLDTEMNSDQLAQAMKKLKVPGVKVSLEGSQPGEITLKVR